MDERETVSISKKWYYCSTCDTKFHEMSGFVLQKQADFDNTSLPVFSCPECLEWIRLHWAYVCSLATGSARLSRVDLVSKLRADIHRDRSPKSTLGKKEGTTFVG